MSLNLGSHQIRLQCEFELSNWIERKTNQLLLSVFLLCSEIRAIAVQHAHTVTRIFAESFFFLFFIVYQIVLWITFLFVCSVISAWPLTYDIFTWMEKEKLLINQSKLLSIFHNRNTYEHSAKCKIGPDCVYVYKMFGQFR